MKKVLISTGGTGGHIFPALAIAELLKREGDVAVSFIGGQDMEKSLIAPRFPLKSLPITPLRFSSAKRFCQSLLTYFISLISAYSFLLKNRPNVILGMGGYPTLPTLISAILLKIPFIIHEQNIVPGRVNALLGSLACKILITFPDTRRFFPPSRTRLVGLPLRSSLKKIEKIEAKEKLSLSPDRFTILVLGGSRGALSINIAISEILPKLLESGFQVIHICGLKHFETLKEMKDLYKGYVLLPFTDEMHLVYSAADLCVSRAGASTLAEIAFFALPSILIPYPHAVSQHQLLNALFFQKMGASLVVKDEELKEPLVLYKKIESLFSCPEKLKSMAVAAFSLARPRAAEEAVKEIKEVIER
ncbi:MAG: undecaprenyldiphospho-muramoylpentapeptide beta-N-acetylglucosaminyltransferase [bacterium]